MEIVRYLVDNPTTFVVYAGLLGLIVGSFLNVVILRLPVMMESEWAQQCAEYLDPNASQQTEKEPFNLVVPRSRCPKCGHGIRAIENIPVLSWLVLRGRCASCKTPIPIRYPVVELITGGLSVFVAWQWGFSAETGAMLLLTWALIALSVIDIDHTLLPDSITLPILWLGLLVNVFEVFVPLRDAVLGAIAGYLSLWLVYQAFRLLTGKEGMGFGDFKLLALLGAWFGWSALPVIIFFSSLIGAVVGIGLIVLRGRDRANPIPFGPYLAAAGWCAAFWGNDLLAWYLS